MKHDETWKSAARLRVNQGMRKNKGKKMGRGVPLSLQTSGPVAPKELFHYCSASAKCVMWFPSLPEGRR